MSAECKNKYEVLKIIRQNVLDGLAAFGQTGWVCAEADQPAIRSLDKVITLKFIRMQRVGYSTMGYETDTEDPSKTYSVSKWIEQQEWEIKALYNRKTTVASDDTITPEDAVYMLASWMNNMGVEYFRNYNCAPLFVQMKDIKTYNDKSDVSQNAISFPLKLQVPKTFVMSYPDAGVICDGIKGY